MLIKKGAIISEYVNIYSFNNRKIGIPIFQRFYAWKEKEIVQLKEDLLKLIDNQSLQLYFLDFIYYEEDEKIKFADGQQRIVTLNNLIKAIKDVARKESILIEDIELFDISYDVINNNGKYRNHFYYDNIIKPFKKVYLNLYDFIYDNISRINDFVKVIKNNIFVFLKKCSNADDAFDIFQQINTGGKPLSKDEVIKTAIDQYSNIYNITFNTNKIKDIRQSLISYYKLLYKNYDRNFDNMEIITFLRDHVTKDKSTFENFVNTMNQLKSLDNCPIRYVINYINRNTLLDVLNILAMKNIDVNKSVLHLQSILIPLCMISVVFTFNGVSPTTFKYLLNDVLDDIKNNKEPNTIKNNLINKINLNSNTWKIKLEDFINKLGDSTTSKNIKKALLIMDVIYCNTSGIINVEKINLEHIYPQNPEWEWANNGWPSSKEEQKKLIDNIGNYLLLSEQVNKRIQNKYITQKKVEYDNIIKKDKILQTPINTVDFNKFENNQKNYIFERQKKIGKLIREELPIGKVLIKN